MTARCILHGHEFQRFKGRGQFRDQEFDVCIHCNKTIPVREPESRESGRK